MEPIENGFFNSKRNLILGGIVATLIVGLVVWGSVRYLRLGTTSEYQSSSTGEEVVEGYGLRKARNYVQERQYAKALKAYKKAFVQTEDVPAMYGVRLSYVLMEMNQLGEKHPPARKVLRKWRNQRKQTVLTGTPAFQTVHELTSINRALGDTESNFGILNKLEANKDSSDRLRNLFASLIWEQFVRYEKYDEMEPYLEFIVKREAQELENFEATYDHPGRVGIKGSRQSEYRKSIRRQIKRNCGTLFLALEKLERTDLKQKVTRRLNHPEFCRTGEGTRERT